MKPGGEPAQAGRRERHKAEVRERLFRAALDLYKTRGLQATTVRDITEAADVGKGTFFNYFPTKEHVLSEFYGRNPGAAQETLDAVRQGAPYREAMLALRRRLAQHSHSPVLTRSFILAFVSNQEVFDIARPHLERTRQVMTELLAIGQARGEIRDDRPASELSRLLQEAAFGTALFWLCNPETSLNELLDANFNILCAPQQASRPAGAAPPSTGAPPDRAARGRRLRRVRPARPRNAPTRRP